ncbi:YhbP family protein [Providencia rustigianii]|uniref:YhbP family protein n=1 Tax=Providencia rustigianii TaxID=158850 RepID=UPI00223EBCA5|nr:YhbP family protein [Providencia rustigianii]
MTSENTLQHIRRYIARQHVFSLFTSHQNDMWSASCYYAFDRPNMRLILMTSPDSQHGQLMLANPHVAGTITAQTKQVSKIQGIQFIGEISQLDGSEGSAMRAFYCQRFPVALEAKLPMWQLQLQTIKMVDNTLGFGTKLHWSREA